MKIWSYSLVIENGGVFFLTTSLIYIWKEITVNSCPQQINLKDVIHWCLLCWYFVYLNICTSIRNIYVLKLYNVTSLLSWFNDLEWFKNCLEKNEYFKGYGRMTPLDDIKANCKQIQRYGWNLYHLHYHLVVKVLNIQHVLDKLCFHCS